MNKKFYVVLFAALVFAMVIGACQSTPAAPAAEDEEAAPAAEEAVEKESEAETKGTIYAIFKDSSSVFFADMGKGAQKAADELGYELVIQNPASELEIDKQIFLVENAIAAEPVGIVLAVISAESLADVAGQVKEAGLPLTCADGGVPSCDALYATDNVQVGADLCDKTVELMGGSGTVYLLSPLAGVPTIIDRESGFRDCAAKYPDIEIVNESVYCDNDKTVCANKILDMLAARNDDIAAIVGTNENALIGIATAIAERDLSGEIIVAGIDVSDDVIAYINDGTIQASAVQNPFAMGYQAVYGIQEMVDGKDLGHAVIDTGSAIVTAENVDDPDIQAIIHPQ